MKLFLFHVHGQIIVVRAATTRDAAVIVANEYADLNKGLDHYITACTELLADGPPEIIMDFLA